MPTEKCECAPDPLLPNPICILCLCDTEKAANVTLDEVGRERPRQRAGADGCCSSAQGRNALCPSNCLTGFGVDASSLHLPSTLFVPSCAARRQRQRAGLRPHRRHSHHHHVSMWMDAAARRKISVHRAAQLSKHSIPSNCPAEHKSHNCCPPSCPHVPHWQVRGWGDCRVRVCGRPLPQGRAVAHVPLPRAQAPARTHH